jgi:hypothetical protein
MTENNQYSWIIDQFKRSLETGYNSKILWGSRSIYRKDWIFLKRFINENRIVKVIEYGVGLSTELMYLEGCRIFCLEDLKWWADHNRKVFKGIKEINIIDYDIGSIPHFKELRFDLAFVDGPKDDRTETVEHAKKYSDIIYCHDKRQQDLIRGDSSWEEFVLYSNYTGHFFKRI